jgi:hypothetical protein
MPDEEVTSEAADDAKTEPTKTETAADMAAEAAKWKALARKHDDQAKANADAAKRLAEIEDASKSDLQKAADKVTAAERRAAESEARALRLEVAGDKGLTPKQAKRLVGSTREELEADADEILADFGSKEPPARPAGRPRENLRGGGDPTDEPAETDPRKLAAQIPR